MCVFVYEWKCCIITTCWPQTLWQPWQGTARAPPSAHVCVFYKVECILSKQYADDMLRAVILTQVSVCLLIRSMQLYQEIIINKYKNTNNLSGWKQN